MRGDHAAAETRDLHAIRLTIPAKPEYVTLCRLAVTGLSLVRDLPDEAVADVKLALTEACSNSVRHAYPGRDGTVEIVYELHDDQLVIEVFDDGDGFELADNGAPPEELSEGGLGIEIIRALADEFEFGSREDGPGSRLRFVKRL